MPQTTVVIKTISLPKSLADRLERRLPRHGDKSRMIARLIEMFLDGEVVVQVPAKKF